jgi:hypothetical protein
MLTMRQEGRCFAIGRCCVPQRQEIAVNAAWRDESASTALSGGFGCWWWMRGIDELEQLAAEIATLLGACAEREGTPDAALMSQVVQHLQSALAQLMERQGMLVGPTPWWTQRQASRGQS